MKPEELNQLRIGNYLLFDTGIRERIVTIHAAHFTHKRVVADFYPMPITELRLFELGFKLTNDEGDIKYYTHPEFSKFSVILDHECITLYFYPLANRGYCIIYDSLHFYAVHHLQNIFYSISGKELKWHKKIGKNRK